MKRKFTKTLGSPFADKDSTPVYTMKRKNWKLREIYSLSDEDLLQFLRELDYNDGTFKIVSHPDHSAHMRLEQRLWNEAMCRGIHPKGQFDDWVQAEREWNRGVGGILHKQGLEGNIKLDFRTFQAKAFLISAIRN